jgi:hypothetical protein
MPTFLRDGQRCKQQLAWRTVVLQSFKGPGLRYRLRDFTDFHNLIHTYNV